MQEQVAAWSLTHGGVSDALRHRLFVHDGYLSEKALATALATCKSWVQMAPPGVLYAAAMHGLLQNRRVENLPEGMTDLPVAARRHIANVITPELDDLSLIAKVERSGGPAPSWTAVGPKGRVDVSWSSHERDTEAIVPGRVLQTLHCLGEMCQDFEVEDMSAAAATALRNITARLVSIHVWENYDKCKEIELYFPECGDMCIGRPIANKVIVQTLMNLARYSARFAGALYDVVFIWSNPMGSSDELKLDDDDNFLLASIARWVPVDQLDAILDVILCQNRRHRYPSLQSYIMESLAARAGEAFAHRADAVPSELAARLIESARNEKKCCELWTSRDAVRIMACHMGRTAAKASARLFLPFVDDTATRCWALQILAWILWEDRRYVNSTFVAKEPIATPDEFRRVASHLEAVNGKEETDVVGVLACLARADTLGDGDGVLRQAVVSIAPRIMDSIRGDDRAGRAYFAFLAEAAIAAVPGAVELLAERFPPRAVRRVAEGTTAADEILLGALSERLERIVAAGGTIDRTVDELYEFYEELKAIAAFGARAARVAPQLVAVLTLADEKAEQRYVTRLVEALVALGPDVYRQQAVSVAEWARKYIDGKCSEAHIEEEDDWQAAIVEDEISGPVRQIIQSLGVEAAPYARELVVLTWYHAMYHYHDCEMEEENFLPEELLLSRCRTLRLVAEFGDRCPDAGVSALLDQVLWWGDSGFSSECPVPLDKRDGRLEAHVFSTLMRLGPTRLAPHAERIIENLDDPEPYKDYDSPGYAVGTVELVAALLPNARAREVLICLLTSETPGMAARDEGQKYDERSLAYAAATALRAADCAVDDETAGRIARILAKVPPHEDYRLAGHSVADVEAACAAELGLGVS